jgi:hypothetical protein
LLHLAFLLFEGLEFMTGAASRWSGEILWAGVNFWLIHLFHPVPDIPAFAVC